MQTELLLLRRAWHADPSVVSKLSTKRERIHKHADELQQRYLATCAAPGASPRPALGAPGASAPAAAVPDAAAAANADAVQHGSSRRLSELRSVLAVSTKVLNSTMRA